jgi:hypothetical protein
MVEEYEFRYNEYKDEDIYILFVCFEQIGSIFKKSIVNTPKISKLDNMSIDDFKDYFYVTPDKLVKKGVDEFINLYLNTRDGKKVHENLELDEYILFIKNVTIIHRFLRFRI